MGPHEAAQLGAVVVGTHEQLALVLVAAGVAGRGLGCRGQALEVELVRVPLTVHLRHYVLVVVVPETREIWMWSECKVVAGNLRKCLWGFLSFGKTFSIVNRISLWDYVIDI